MKIFSKYPWILSLLLILALASWLASGLLQAAPEIQPKNKAESHIPKVRVRSMIAEPVTRSIILYGRTEPGRSATLRTEMNGKVTEIYAQRGQQIKKNDPVARLDLNDRDKLLTSARARLAQHRIEFEGARSLSIEGYQGKAKLAQSQADLRESEALVAQLENEIRNTLILAPFDGVIYDRFIEIGDYVTSGEAMAEIIDLNPLIVIGNASQKNINSIAVNQQAIVKLPANSKHSAKVRYVSPMSDKQTNTFRVEVSIDNPDLDILAGLTTEIDIPLTEVKAIKISPALFSLDEEGVIGIKSVKNNIVHFNPINIIKSEADGVWISTPDPQIEIITVGQAFVKKGDKVEAIQETNSKGIS